MKYAFISDVHGNLDALQAVMSAIDSEAGIDKVLCGGDVVGYGAEPSECIALIRERGIPTIAGNHDYAAIGRMDLSYFNPFAREAAEWTADHLSDRDKEYIENLPLTREEDRFIMVHGTLDEPESFGYVLTEFDARLMFMSIKTDFCFTGHSHFPCVFVQNKALRFSRDPEVRVDASERALVNVGSVGQPRDSDPRACYVIYGDEERTVATRRVEYDVEKAAGKIVDAGLPEVLAERIFSGI